MENTIFHKIALLSEFLNFLEKMLPHLHAKEKEKYLVSQESMVSQVLEPRLLHEKVYLAIG
jgi:hypothetical protein